MGAVPSEASALRRHGRSSVALPVVAVLAVTALAAGLRFWNLGSPPERIFDEFYYSKSACIYLGWSQERCEVTSDDERYWYRERHDVGSWVHPPLGKWAIALGELAVGTDASDGLSERDAFGFRAASAIAGTLTVAIVAVLLQLLFRSALWTSVGGVLLATEGLSIVQSRVAMLDVFVTMWIALAFLCLVADRRWMERRTPAIPAFEGPGEIWLPWRGDTPSPLWRPWRFAAGISLGLGLATKWSAATALGGVIILAWIWEWDRRRKERRSFAGTIAREGFGILLALVVLPLVIYVVADLAWFLREGWDLARWGELQLAMARYHTDLRPIGADGKPIHPYLSPAWEWLLLARPVLYFAEYFDDGARRVIYANGNPVVFWGGFMTITTAAVTWWRRHDWRGGFIVVAFTALYLPWFFVERPQFLFYALPLVPVLVVALVALLRGMVERGHAILAGALITMALGLSALFWPTYVGLGLDAVGWQLRSWFPGWT